MLKQEGVIPFDEDQEMIDLYTHLDTLSAFDSLHSAWQQENADSWHSNEIKKQLDRITRYVDQLASYISVYHDDIAIQINVDVETLKRKQFSTVIKRTDEWKSLKKWVKSEHDFTQQTIAVEAICKCILIETKKLIQIV